ncbi:MAG TPA: hypothetical protein VKV80_05190 [Streptosporangiaceae bacterium]|nr:hypothetical protein [Streptosporangiaceae bacterium]
MCGYPPCPVCAPPPCPPPLAVTSAAQALRDTHPDYEVTITWRPGGWRFEVVRVRGQGNPVCLISADPGEIYHALGGGQSAGRR